ncbi:MAG: IclR family transcriptional regulator [Rhodobacteraceae bacterium]|nr:IclR family transcriptional regulator [Paracoccaceae bacterium]
MNTQVRADGTVGKALEILDIAVGYGRAVRFSELLELSPYPKATLHRLLQTLTNQGMLNYDEDRHVYSPGLRLVRLTQLAWNQTSLAPLARPFLDALAADVKETIHLAQMEHSRVIFIDKRKSSGQFETLAQPGRLAPLHCTGVGKVMLAFMHPARRDQALSRLTFEKFTPATHTSPATLLPEIEEIRAEGIGFDRQEHEQGIMSMAAPILGAGGKVIGALSIVTSAYRMNMEDLEALRPALQRTATQIGTEAALWPFPIAS